MKWPVIGLVGPCTSGKSTIRDILEARGFPCRHIAQEHSVAPSMWWQVGRPDALIFLDVSYPVTLKRRRWNWTPADFEEQQRRLSHARRHADLLIDTDPLTPVQVADRISQFVADLE